MAQLQGDLGQLLIEVGRSVRSQVRGLARQAVTTHLGLIAGLTHAT